MQLLKMCLAIAISINSVLAIAAESASVPLHVINVGEQDYKVGIEVSVAGGPPSLVTFDTGGTGLHIFASQVGHLNLRYTNQVIQSSFASGLVYEGRIAYAPVSFGKISTPPIPILVIEKAYCVANKPNCGARGNPSNPQPVMGHFYGELGAGMIPETHGSHVLYAPFRALPGNYGSGFIIKNLHREGRGELVLGLNANNTHNFNRVQLEQMGTYPDGTPFYNDKGTRVRYSINGIYATLRTAYDTGGGSVVRFLTGNQEGFNARGALIRPRQAFKAVLPGAFRWQFITGVEPGINWVITGPVVPAKGPYVNTGIGFYFKHDVIFDFADGQLGFKLHEKRVEQ